MRLTIPRGYTCARGHKETRDLLEESTFCAMWTTIDYPVYRKAFSLPADPGDDSAIVTAVAFSPSGDRIAVASRGESASFMRVYATDSRLLVKMLNLRSVDATGTARSVEATCLAWHPSAKAVIIGDDRGGVWSISLLSSEVRCVISFSAAHTDESVALV